jgi:hypothetical protein
MDTWNTLPESYQQRVYNNPLATVKCQIQQAENPMPAMVISMEAAAHVDNAIPLDHSTSEVALNELEIGSTDLNIPIDTNCTYDELHFVMPGGSADFDDQGDESDAIPTASQRRRAATELEMLDLGTRDVNEYQGEHSNDGDADDEEEVSESDDGLTQNVED